MKLNKILCPVDFSDRSDRALEYAVFIATTNDASLTLVHVVDHLQGEDHFFILSLTAEELQKKLESEARKKLDLLAQKYSDTIKVETVIRAGKPFVEIVRMAKENDIDQIIMGSHGRTGIPHMLLGSVAEKVSRKAPCPVLIFKEKGAKFELP